MRTLAGVLVAIVISASGGALAQATLNKPECTKANIDSTDEKVSKMPDGPRKTTAASEIASARNALESGQTQGCQDHLLKADVQTK